MMAGEIIKKINTLLVNEFEVDPEKITPDAQLKEALDLDSLDYIDLVVLTDVNFGCKMKPEDFTNIHTFQDFYNYIENHVNTNV